MLSNSAERVHDLRPYAEDLGVNLYNTYPANPLYPANTPEHVLGKAALRMLQGGTWPFGGRMGLEVWQQESPNMNAYFHGSYKSPEEIGRILLPKQAMWFDANGDGYRDGKPAVALDGGIDLPIIRSLLNGKAPGMDECAYVLMRRDDADGFTHWFTTKDALDKCRYGYVYIVQPPGPLQKYQCPVLGTREEYRVHNPVAYAGVVRSAKTDLPGSLLVIDAPTHEVEAFLDLVPEGTPKEVSEALGIEVQPLGGEWPVRSLANFPALRPAAS